MAKAEYTVLNRKAYNRFNGPQPSSLNDILGLYNKLKQVSRRTKTLNLRNKEYYNKGIANNI